MAETVVLAVCPAAHLLEQNRGSDPTRWVNPTRLRYSSMAKLPDQQTLPPRERPKKAGIPCVVAVCLAAHLFENASDVEVG